MSVLFAPHASAQAPKAYVGGDPNGGQIGVIGFNGAPLAESFDVKTGQTRVLTQGGGPFWSPDGARYAFFVAGNGTLPALAVLGIDGTSSGCATVPSDSPCVVYQSTPDAYVSGNPSWSPPRPGAPNGELLFQVSSQTRAFYALIAVRADVDHGPSRVVFQPPAPGQVANPAWSPTTDRFAVMIAGQGTADIWTMDGNGGNLTQITHTRGDATLPTSITEFRLPEWSPDGTRLAYVGQNMFDVPPHLFTNSASGGTEAEVSPIYNLSFGENSPIFWSPFGNRFAYNGGNPDHPSSNAIQVFDIASAGWAPDTISTGGVSAGVVSGWRAEPYVALGDSYASGAGDKLYRPDSDGQDGTMCRRAVNGFPYRLGLPLPIIFGACGGAVIQNFYHSQHTDQELAQLDHLSTTTSLVTVMISGNDTLLIPMYQLCLFAPVSDLLAALGGQNLGFVPGIPCGQQRFGGVGPTLASFMDKQVANQYAPLKQLYRDIRTRAPNARILSVLYPNPMPSNPGVHGPFPCDGTAALVNAIDQVFLFRVLQDLNGVIFRAALDSGANVEPVDPNGPFVGHDVCAGLLESWFLQPIQSLPDLAASMHPNAAGEASIAQTILTTLGSPPRGISFNVLPAQTVQTSTSVSSQQGAAVFSSSWPGSDIVMSLVSPTGRVFDRATIDPSVDHTASSTFEVYKILRPEAGTWTVNFFGADVAPQGEAVSFRFNQSPPFAGDVNGDGVANCADLAIVKASFGRKTGQFGFDPRADLNQDGIVDIRDMSVVAQQLLPGTTCQ